eukprot:m.132815 g.132815  ORF g.132815 m.132815 type:complete len:333 (+) comp13815_c0_seq5:128-1126(+)
MGQGSTVRSWLGKQVGWRGVEWAQRCRSPLLDAWFTHSPLLGNESMYVLLCPLMAWVVDPTVGLARAFLLGTVLATFVNNAIKDILDLPRPPAKYHVDPPAHGEPGGIYEQPGFPSTHSANAFVSGLVVAKHGLGAGWLTPTSAGVLVLLHTSQVVFSRLYMGVHSLCDVTGGLFIGVGVGGAVWVLADQLDALFVTPILGLVAVLAVAAGIALVYPKPAAANTAFTECLIFAGLHGGLCLGTPSPAAVNQINAHLSRVGGGRLALELLVGGVLTLVLRQCVSSFGKMLVAAVPGGASRDKASVVREYTVLVVTAAFVARCHPSAVCASLGL